MITMEIEHHQDGGEMFNKEQYVELRQLAQRIYDDITAEINKQFDDEELKKEAAFEVASIVVSHFMHDHFKLKTADDIEDVLELFSWKTAKKFVQLPIEANFKKIREMDY